MLINYHCLIIWDNIINRKREICLLWRILLKLLQLSVLRNIVTNYLKCKQWNNNNNKMQWIQNTSQRQHRNRSLIKYSKKSISDITRSITIEGSQDPVQAKMLPFMKPKRSQKRKMPKEKPWTWLRKNCPKKWEMMLPKLTHNQPLLKLKPTLQQ